MVGGEDFDAVPQFYPIGPLVKIQRRAWGADLLVIVNAVFDGALQVVKSITCRGSKHDG